MSEEKASSRHLSDEDAGAVARDDALMTALGAGGVGVENNDALSTFLLDWRQSIVDAEVPAVPAIVTVAAENFETSESPEETQRTDVETSVAATSHDSRVVSITEAKKRPRKTYWLTGAGALVAGLAILAGVLVVTARTVTPSSPLWTVKTVLYPQEAGHSQVVEAETDLAKADEVLGLANQISATTIAEQIPYKEGHRHSVINHGPVGRIPSISGN